MLITTLESYNVPDAKVEILGLVKGSTIKTVNMFKDIGSAFKTLIGGELKNYTKMIDDARAEATRKMTMEAEAMGANAILGVRFSTSSVMQGAAEIMVYGTAVRIQNEPLIEHVSPVPNERDSTRAVKDGDFSPHFVSTMEGVHVVPSDKKVDPPASPITESWGTIHKAPQTTTDPSQTH